MRPNVINCASGMVGKKVSYANVHGEWLVLKFDDDDSLAMIHGSRMSFDGHPGHYWMHKLGYMSDEEYAAHEQAEKESLAAYIRDRDLKELAALKAKYEPNG